jgi:hypothetical protein
VRVQTSILCLTALLLGSQLAFARTSLQDADDEAYTGHFIDSWDTIWDDEAVAQSGGTTTPPVATPAPVPAPTTPPAPPVQAEPDTPLEEIPGQTPDGGTPSEENGVDDEFSLGDLPIVETVELTADGAKKAIDAYLLVRDKYKDADLESFENLQDFVDQTPQGKSFEQDVKAAGFANVNEWNTVVTTISFAYGNIIDDQTDEIKQQIEEIKVDTEMAQDMRDRMIAALSAMIPSDNNKKIVEDLIKDPVFGEKVKALETEEE